MAKNQSRKSAGETPDKGGKLAECVRKSVQRYLRDLNGEEASRMYQMVLDQVEKPLLEVVMKHSEDNQSRASRMLGINRNTLRKKLDTHRIGEQ